MTERFETVMTSDADDMARLCEGRVQIIGL
ncbi:hypothetical protein FHR32_006349 [Streptosporangium album]|uniref:Uncharacterized protein n=1 Tax=Streptosporangium album TaxID=47479 RepID=A0A7W7S2E2_9ACTN|nr:hypothetical protein [Streptosporangium album]